MEENVDVIEACAKLMAEYFQRMSAGIFHHWEDVFLDYVETFACEEDDVMVELERLGITGSIQSAESAGTNQLLGKDD